MLNRKNPMKKIPNIEQDRNMTVVIIVDDEHEGVVAVPRIGGE